MIFEIARPLGVPVSRFFEGLPGNDENSAKLRLCRSMSASISLPVPRVDAITHNRSHSQGYNSVETRMEHRTLLSIFQRVRALPFN